MRIAIRSLIAFMLALATSSLYAITYIVPTDRDLVRRSEAIVIATSVESHSQYTTDGRIVTIATLALDEVLKGELGGQSSIDLIEAGGFVGDRATAIPGSPRYAAGKQYLVFLRRTTDGWATYGFSLGKFEFVNDLLGRQLVTRGGSDEIFGWDEMTNTPHIETLRDATAFQTFVRTVMASADAPARADYFVDRGAVVLQSQWSYTPKPLAGFTRPDYLLSGNFRWQSPTANFDYCCSPFTVPGGLDGPGGIAAGTSNWTSAGAGVQYGVGAANPSATHGLVSADGINAVLFNDPSGQVPAGIAALGGISSATGQYTLSDGFMYFNTVEVDVVVGKNFSTTQATFNGLMTHEIGHTLGFRHSDQNAAGTGPCVSPSPCTSTAIMNSSVAFNLQTLQQWDLDAVQTVYGSGPVCNAPSITTQPASQSITSGSQANLTVAASGSAPLTYQWYIGNSPSLTNPVGGATSTTFRPTPTATTSYWVRVTGCNSLTADSNTAVVTITCAAPSAPAPTASPSSIASGQSSTVSVTATGTGPFTYQWYSGNSGVITNPIGGATSSSSVTVSPTTTTSYWVRVTGQCAPAADSPATVVTVAACVPSSAPTPLASPSSIPSGQSSTVSVNANGTGPFTYQWFTGNSGVTTIPIGVATSNSFIIVTPTATTAYWVRVTGQCGSPSDSPATVVTVTCSPIASGSPFASPQTINAGESSTLTVNTVGSGPFTYQWYAGNSGDVSNLINGATSNTTVVSPTINSAFWVRVTAPCGTQDSNSAIVFVNGAVCNPPSITTQPASTTISAGASVTLTVSASGTAPLTYRWYIGDKGDISNLIGGATSFSLTQTPTVTTKYWVRVSGCNNTSTDSNAATVTVPSCTPPSITTQPANVSAAIGTAATLKVVAAGTGLLHYQWYQGTKGDTSKKVGADSATLVTGAISGNTAYWVRVTGTCGNPADSNAATVTALAPPRGRAARH